jgi:hypothetical protein
MSHQVQSIHPPRSESAVERQYEAFLGHLTVKGRSTVQKHDESCETAGDQERGVLWKRLAGGLGQLANHAIEVYDLRSVKFYVADGKYKLQVFALEDTPQGTLVVYFPDVAQTAVSEKIITGGTSPQLYRVPGGAEPLHLTPINAETPDMTVCKAMLGWGRRALRAEFALPMQEAHVRAVEHLCELAARKWAAA